MGQANPLDYAIQLERDGQAFYAKAAAETKSPLGRKMYESLAADERRHEAILRDVAKKMAVSLEGDLPKQRLVTLFATLGPDLKAQLGADPSDSAVIGKAIEMEKASVDLYQKQGAASDAAQRALYERLAQEEAQHVDILRNTLTYLDRTASWFLWDEQALLDGG